MKKKKLWLKLLLDLGMLIVLMLLFWKGNFGIKFHEIAGLVILGVFLFHIVINWRWVCQITKHFFNRNITVRARIEWMINVGLLICFVIIGISGIFMSRVVFHFSVDGNWRTPHYFCSALAIILVGIHLGLHLTMISGMLCKQLRLNSVFAKIINICFVIIVIITGCYSINTTSFKNWITMPFSANVYEKNDIHAGSGNNQREMHKGDSASSSKDSPQRSIPNGDTNQTKNFERKSRQGKSDEKQMRATIGAIIWKAVQYAAICLLFAIFTWFIDRFVQRRRNKMRLLSKNN